MTTLEEVFLRLGEREEFHCNSAEEKSEFDNNSESILLEPASTSPSASAHHLNVPEEEGPDPNVFEPVSTSEKSAWRQFWTMVGVRGVNKVREPTALFVQIVLPVLYICLGIFLQSGGKTTVGNEDRAVLSAALYKESYQPNLFGVQNVTEELSTFIENSTGTTVLHIPPEVEFEDLLGNNLVGVIRRDSEGQLLGYFNSTAQHSVPMMINLISNFYSSQYRAGHISLSTQSFVFEANTVETGEIFKTFGACLLIGMAYVIAPLGMALELIYDRSVGLKNQLRVNGLPTLLYYGSFFFVLSLMMVLMLVMMIIVIVAFNVELLMIPSAAVILFSLYLLYTLPCLIFVGCLSFLFNTMETGQNVYLFAR